MAVKQNKHEVKTDSSLATPAELISTSRFSMLNHKKRGLILGASMGVIVIAVLIAVFALGGDRGATGGMTFPDISSRNPGNKAASAMVGYGLMETQTDGSFMPDAPVTRAEFSSLLVKTLGSFGQVTDEPSFTDVTPSHPQYFAIESVKLLFGYQSQDNEVKQTFQPDLPIMRSEALAVASKALCLYTESKTLAEAIGLPENDPVFKASSKSLTRLDAARLFNSLINSRIPQPSTSFSIKGIR